MDILLTLIAGFLLAVMMYLNGTLSFYTDPVWSSWITHITGTIAAFFIVTAFGKERTKAPSKAPLWSYMGGILGALTVIIANITFNSRLGISGSFVLILVGQIILSFMVDIFGWFGMPKRKIGVQDVMQVVFVCLGSVLVVAYAK